MYWPTCQDSIMWTTNYDNAIQYWSDRILPRLWVTRPDEDHKDSKALYAMLRSIVRPDKVPDSTLAQLPADLLLTIEEVLSYLPIQISRRSWLEGSRSGRYPAPVRINRKTLRWRTRDIQQYVALLTGETGWLR